jgi:predicted regulator of Ras-like GTPase activity (Roadblock/LC7/MglB family)
MSNRVDQIQHVLRMLVNNILDVEGAAMVTTDGLTLASALPTGSDEDRVSAMAAAILSMGERTSDELKRGVLEQVIVKGNAGYVILMQAGPEAVLETISGPSAKLGTVLLDMTRAAKELSILV